MKLLYNFPIIITLMIYTILEVLITIFALYLNISNPKIQKQFCDC